MTQEDKTRYDALPEIKKASYDFYAKRHPEWQAYQIFSMIGLEDVFNEGIDGGDKDGGKIIDKPKGQKIILEKLDNWFLKNYPDLHSKVSPIIQNAINKLIQLIAAGINYVKSIYETLKELFT